MIELKSVGGTAIYASVGLQVGSNILLVAFNLSSLRRFSGNHPTTFVRFIVPFRDNGLILFTRWHYTSSAVAVIHLAALVGLKRW